MFVFDGLVQAVEQFVQGRILPAFDHGEEIELALGDMNVMGIRILFTADPVNLGTETLDIAPADIGMAVDGKSGDLLSVSLLTEPGLGFVDGEAAAGDDGSELLHELSILMIDMMVAAEGDVIGIARIGEMEPPASPASCLSSLIVQMLEKTGEVGAPWGRTLTVQPSRSTG